VDWRQAGRHHKQHRFSLLTVAILWCGLLGACQYQADEVPTACPSPQIHCEEGEPVCADLQVDPKNCGACGEVCDEGRRCSAGKCVATCAKGYSGCGDDGSGVAAYCADLNRDRDNCGECGEPCEAGQLCSEGECAATCTNGYTACGDDGDGNATYCADVNRDWHDCGSCGEPCEAGQLCSEGECVATCADGYTACGDDGDGNATYCADVNRDRYDCGACGEPCEAGQLCSEGECVATCTDGYTACGDDGNGNATYCADLSRDRDNCGECREQCQPGLCSDGRCVVSCTAGYAKCGDDGSGEAPYCADLSQDRDNCGECGEQCQPGHLCSEGECVVTCTAGYAECGDDGSGETTYCADLSRDRDNCGACEEQCQPGHLCSEGKCVVTCTDGHAECGDDGSGQATYCADLADDPHDCGACGEACDDGFACQRGVCVISCAADSTSCSADGAAYCADLKRNRDNCGRCGAVCQAGHLCSEGECVVTCTDAYSACGQGDGPATYCADLFVDSANCGGCGDSCPSGFSCREGSCAISCSEGYAACLVGGIEYCADLERDGDNCGACGSACASGFLCSDGGCTVSCTDGYSACSKDDGENASYCAQLSDDAHNCGSCGTSCADGFACSEGHCTASCTAGYTACPVDAPAYCADLSRSPFDCGACGEACPEGFLCSGGTCVAGCTEGYTACSEVVGEDATYCALLANDAHNCGACRRACTAGQACVDGTCRCPDPNPDLCGSLCTDLGSDPQNCGTCGKRCAPGFVCDGTGACSLSCQEGLDDCRGTCVDLTLHPANCGSCGEACADDEVCSGGDCVSAGGCSGDAMACSGNCVDVRFDPNNCGTCGVRCGAGQVCSQKSCEDRCLGSTLCGSRCADLELDPRNCGECGNVCADDETCVDGDCAPGQPTGPRCQSTLSIPLNSQAPFPPTAPPGCQLLSDGSGRMTYVLGTGDGPFAACVFANGVSLKGFDADQDAAGALEVEFCADQPTSGEVNLWYGAFPTRKKVELLRASEMMDPGCRTVRRAPEQAVCHWTARTDWDDDCSNFTGIGFDSRCIACGSQCNQGCPITFDSTRLTFTAEQATLAQTTPAVLTLKAVRFLPEDCACTGDRQCEESPDRTECEPGLFSSSICPSGAPLCGVCVAPAPSCKAPLTLCGDACVDTLDDEQHCGECDSVCSLPEGVAACVGGACRLVDCEPGFGDADGEEANGCECTETNEGREECDGVDNDCDGLIDFVLEPDPHSVCECFERAISIDRDLEDGEGGCRPATCEPYSAGGIEMTYCFDECDVSKPYASCLFAGPVDLSDFDANFGRDGVLEVVFEVVAQAIVGKLQLNYGNHPRRKYVELVSRGETLPPGVYRQYYTPDQVRFSSASPICRESCGPCDQVPGDPSYRFAAVDMTLVAEGCASAVDARVRLLSVEVVATGCGCVSSSDCADTPERSVCYPPDSGAGICGWPGTVTPGVCGAASGCDGDVSIDTPCAIMVLSTTCSGTWQCRDGTAVCEVVSCP
jgi:hypothetical protein